VAKTCIGVALFKSEQYFDAEPYYADGLEDAMTTFGADHPNTFIPQANMALLIARAKWTEKMAGAETMAQAAHSGFVKHLGGSHPLTHFGSATLGVVLRAEGKQIEARPFLQQAHDGVAGKEAGKWVVELFQGDFEAVLGQ
jgi:hypothetical protein